MLRRNLVDTASVVNAPPLLFGYTASGKRITLVKGLCWQAYLRNWLGIYCCAGSVGCVSARVKSIQFRCHRPVHMRQSQSKDPRHTSHTNLQLGDSIMGAVLSTLRRVVGSGVFRWALRLMAVLMVLNPRFRHAVLRRLRLVPPRGHVRHSERESAPGLFVALSHGITHYRDRCSRHLTCFGWACY